MRRYRSIAQGLAIEALLKKPSVPCQDCGGMGFRGEHRRWEQPCGSCNGTGIAPPPKGPAEQPPSKT